MLISASNRKDCKLFLHLLVLLLLCRLFCSKVNEIKAHEIQSALSDILKKMREDQEKLEGEVQQAVDIATSEFGKNKQAIAYLEDRFLSEKAYRKSMEGERQVS